MKLPEWPERLAAVVDERRRELFAWGTNDCATFAADCVLAMTERDPLGAVRGSYDDEEGALAEIGADGLEARITATLGPPVARTLLGRGDLALIAGTQTVDGRVGLGVVLLNRIAMPGPSALLFLPRSYALRGWKVS